MCLFYGITFTSLFLFLISLFPSLDEKILQAIEKLNYRVSIYDVIMETGLDSQYIEAQLSLLLYKTKGKVHLYIISTYHCKYIFRESAREKDR